MHQLEYDWWETPLVGQVDKETKRILEITIWNKKSEIFNYRKTGGGKKWVRFTVNFGDSTDKEDKGHSTAVATYFGYLCPTFPGARASRSLLLSFRVHFACSNLVNHTTSLSTSKLPRLLELRLGRPLQARLFLARSLL